jgi:DNA mismatch repair protein MutH
MQVMKKWAIAAAAVCMLLVVAGCGSSGSTPYQDESAVKVAITSEPAAVSGKPLQLTANIQGLVTEQNLKVDFDIREETEQELPILIESKKNAPGTYQVEHTFDKPGKYVIYIHIYSGDELHITKRTTFDVA